jgi:hypothetical protein
VFGGMSISIEPPTGQEATHYQQWLQGAIQIGVAFAAGYFTHLFTSSRDKKGAIADRRRDFLIFMQTWRADFTLPRFGHGSDDERVSAFIHGIIPFQGFVTSIQDDFTGMNRVRFDDLVAAIPKTYIHDDKKTLDALDAMIEYVTRQAAPSV